MAFLTSAVGNCALLTLLTGRIFESPTEVL